MENNKGAQLEQNKGSSRMMALTNVRHACQPTLLDATARMEASKGKVGRTTTL